MLLCMQVSDEEEDGEMPDLLIQNDMALDEEEEEEEEEEEGDLTRTVLGYTAEWVHVPQHTQRTVRCTMSYDIVWAL